MATLRAAPTQPGSPWCLKKEGPANKGEMEPPTPTTPKHQAQQLHRNKHTYQMKAADSESNAQKTAVQAPSNSVLNSTAM